MFKKRLNPCDRLNGDTCTAADLSAFYKNTQGKAEPIDGITFARKYCSKAGNSCELRGYSPVAEIYERALENIQELGNLDEQMESDFLDSLRIPVSYEIIRSKKGRINGQTVQTGITTIPRAKVNDSSNFAADISTGIQMAVVNEEYCEVCMEEHTKTKYGAYLVLAPERSRDLLIYGIPSGFSDVKVGLLPIGLLISLNQRPRYMHVTDVIKPVELDDFDIMGIEAGLVPEKELTGSIELAKFLQEAYRTYFK